MNIARHWLDVDDRPHTEQTEWRAVGPNEPLDAGEVLTVPAPAIVTDPLPGRVILLTVSDPAAEGDYNAPGYYALPLWAGATIVDETAFNAALEAAIVTAVDVEAGLAEYLASLEPTDPGSMIDKIAYAANLTVSEKAALQERLG